MLAGTAAQLSAAKHKVFFDSSRRKSGAKIALSDIAAGLPKDWTPYEYVGIEFKVTTTQRFLVGFTTDHGYDELLVHSYVPGQWNRLVIPLRYFAEPPASSHDFASMYNKPRQTGWVNIGGNVGPMTGVDSIGIRQYMPFRDAYVEIRDVQLYREDPGDAYLGDKPAVDAFGQSNLVSWKGKIKSLKKLRKAWRKEEKEMVSAQDLYGYSTYGGYKANKTVATGFFRTEETDGKWWIVDPEGYRFLGVGACCIGLGSGGIFKDLYQRKDMLEEMPPGKFIRSGKGNEAGRADFSLWNLERRFGADYVEPALALTIKRMDKWGLNTIGNWSDARVEKCGKKAFTCTMYPAGIDGALFGLGDPYEDGIEQRLRKSLAPLMEGYRDNKWLIGYYVGNEPTWLGNEQRVCENLLGGKDRAMKTALTEYLRKHGDTHDTRRQFVYDTFDLYLTLLKRVQKSIDPNHLNLGYRFANPYAINEKLAAVCARHFDIMSFNCYAIQPDHKLMDRLLAWTHLPMFIGEFHFGAVDRGLGQSLFQVAGQKERGAAYRYYVEQGFSHPGLVGMTYFTWMDEDVMGRFDGENYNCGLIDVTNVPYREQTEAMMETARCLYGVHAGDETPFARRPDRIVGMERGEDEW